MGSQDVRRPDPPSYRGYTVASNCTNCSLLEYATGKTDSYPC